MTEAETKEAINKIGTAKDEAALEQLRLYYLGRKGVVTKALRSLKDLSPAERTAAGSRANQAKKQIEAAVKTRLGHIQRAELLNLPSIDLTAPGKGLRFGNLHPVREIEKELIQAFWQIGFQVASGPEVENDWYNFEALNMPADHPARDMQDTFYLENGLIPRTHTSSVQIRYMEKHQPPIRIIAPGNVYRNEDEDPTHLWAHRQMEALVVDKDISFGDLKGTILYMLRSLLGPSTKLRLRPSYFPYTEPSAEMDASCPVCGGKDSSCRLCKGTGWVELGGSGMVHPQVLTNVGIDPKLYSGFAFGFGMERMAVIKYGIDDVRYLWRPDLRFMEQF